MWQSITTRFPLLLCAALCWGTAALAQQEQLLFSENFNDCALPDGWVVEQTGHPDAVWYVGLPTNTNANGSSIDGSCLLVFDDDATGDNTPPWTVSLVSPPIDLSGWSTALLSVDVHFRNYDGTDALELLAFDGQQYRLLRTYEGWAGHSGELFSQYVTFTADLSLYTGGITRLMVRYRNGNTWTWWAGVDNIRVVGQGQATNLVAETFDGCTLPEGWATEVLNGAHDWQFGQFSNPNAWGGNSINGSCLAFFDDDVLGEDAAPSTVRLYTPVINATTYANLHVSFDVVLRRYEALEGLKVGVYDEATGEHRTAVEYLADLGGPQPNQYLRETIDLSLFRAPSMRVYFEYSDGLGWGWWVALDNVKVSGQGTINDLCETAAPLEVDAADCTPGSNRTALYLGDQPACAGGRNVGALWYEFTAPANGWVKATSGAGYNDVATLLTGGCDALQPVLCTNRDEHGFTGEAAYFPTVAGQSYRLRISGQEGTFGRARGEMCIRLESVAGPPPAPANDQCASALPLSLGADCLPGHNRHAGFEGPAPSRNLKSRADIWYTFTPTDAQPVDLVSHADFADVLTVFTGGCGQLTEVATNEYGRTLRLEQPVPGTTYYLQISGFFATLEGQVCPQVVPAPQAPPANDLCATALPVAIDGACVAATNAHASWQGPAPSCDVPGTSAIWFRFVAPNSGTVKLNSRADFTHTLTVYSGGCNGLQEVFCRRNPLACDDYLTVASLLPGHTYWVRIGSSASVHGFAATGEVCLHLLNGTAMPPHPPLSLVVDVVCAGGEDGQARLEIAATGGAGGYVFQGNPSGQWLGPGEPWLVVVTDAEGCERAASGVVDCAQAGCVLSMAIQAEEPTCHGDTNGALTATAAGGQGEGYTWAWSNGGTGAGISGLAPGYYSLTVTDGGGCVGITDTYLPEPPPLDIFVESITHENMGQSNGAIHIAVAGGRPPYAYEWRTNGAVVSTAQNLTQVPSGDYTLLVTDANGCTQALPPITVFGATATQEPTWAAHIHLYPNPTAGLARLSLHLPDGRPLRVSLWDMAGRRLADYPVPHTREAIFGLDLTGYAAGVYMVRVQSGREVVAKRLVVVR